MNDKIPVSGGEIPAALYRHLAPIAKRNHVRILDLLVELATRQLATPSPGGLTPATEADIDPGARPHRSWSQAEEAALRHYHRLGHSDNTIARHLKRAASTISKRRKAAGLAPNYNSPRQDLAS